MGAVTLMKTPAETALVQAFEAAKGKLPGDRNARVKAFSDFIEVGLPHRRVEEFKYTDLRASMQGGGSVRGPALGGGSARSLSNDHGSRRSRTRSRSRSSTAMWSARHPTSSRLPEGVEIVTLAEAHRDDPCPSDELSPVPLARDNPVYRLNSAFMTDGVVIRVAANGLVEPRSTCASSRRARKPSRPRPACSSSSRSGVRHAAGEP